MRTEIADEAARASGPLEELYVRNAPAAMRTAYFLTDSADLAEDLVQEAFVRVAGRFGHLRTPDAFPAYLRRIPKHRSPSGGTAPASTCGRRGTGRTKRRRSR